MAQDAPALAFHEAALIFPIDDENIEALADDIRTNGQRVPVELLDGKVIDGRRRLAACHLAGVKPLVIHVAPADPVAYVLSLNLHRRHLDTSQRSMIGARAREVYEKMAKERQRLSKGAGKKGTALAPDLKGDSRATIGKAVGVGGKSIDAAKAVIVNGTPKLVAAVDAGKVSVTGAARAVALPPDMQDAVADGEIDPPAKHEQVSEQPEGERRGVGVIRANEAVNCLIRIPKNDALRKRGFQIVTDWIKANK